MECPWFRGVAGIWPWPVVNILLSLACRIRMMAVEEWRASARTQGGGGGVEYELVRDREGRRVRVVSRG